jgi:hypothetical protein
MQPHATIFTIMKIHPQSYLNKNLNLKSSRSLSIRLQIKLP